MNSGSITKLRQNITTIMAAVSVAVVAIPAARAAEPDLVSALRDQGAQIVPLGPRGGLAGYLVTPVGGAGYSLYVTNDGHGVAGLLYGPDGALLTGGQLAAVRGENHLASAAPSSASGAPNPTANVEGAGVRDSGASTEAATPDTSAGVSRAVSVRAFGVRFRFHPWRARTVGRPVRRSPVSVVALGRGADRPRGDGRQAAAACRAGGAVGRGVSPPGGGDRRQFRSGASLVRPRRWSIRRRHARERIAGNNALFDTWGKRSVPLIAYRAMQGGIAHRVGDIADLGAWLRELGDE